MKHCSCQSSLTIILLYNIGKQIDNYYSDGPWKYCIVGMYFVHRESYSVSEKITMLL